MKKWNFILSLVIIGIFNSLIFGQNNIDLKEGNYNVTVKGEVTKEDIKDFITIADTTDFLKVEDINHLATKEQVNGLVKQEDISNFITSDSIKDFITVDAIKNFLTKDEIQAVVSNATKVKSNTPVDLSNFLLGDGTNETAAFQQLINTSLSSVFVLPQNFNIGIAGSINITKPVHIIGVANSKFTQLAMPNPGVGMFRLSGNAHTSSFKNFIVEGKETDANHHNPASNSLTQHVFWLNNVNNVTFNDITIKGKSSGISVNGSHFCKINNLRFEGIFINKPNNANWFQAIETDSKNTSVVGAHITNTGAGLTVGSPCQNLSVTQCYIDRFFDNGIYMSTSLDAVVTENKILNGDTGSSSGIKIRGGGNRVSLNNIENCINGISCTGNQAFGIDGAYGTIISNNSIRDCHGGIYVAQHSVSRVTPSGVSIIGNNIRNTGIRGKECIVVFAGGLKDGATNPTEDVIIANNVISGTYKDLGTSSYLSLIKLQGSLSGNDIVSYVKNVQVVNNVLHGTDKNNAYVRGLSVDATESFVISGLTCSNIQHGIYIDRSRKGVITNATNLDGNFVVVGSKVPPTEDVVLNNCYGLDAYVAGNAAPLMLLLDSINKTDNQHILSKIDQAPRFIGQRAYIAPTKEWKISKGTESVNDWKDW